MAETEDPMAAARERLEALSGENGQIVDGDYDEALAVRCMNGTFVGKRTPEEVIAYKGIPYVAKQPSGDLRLKAPVCFEPDDGVYEAHYFGKIPLQESSVMHQGSLCPQSEECLWLNVWRADDARGGEPVMVWVHGGAYEVGLTAEPREEGTNFVAANSDVVLVSVEYRLNAYGFLHLSHLPDGADYADARNLGIMDQALALRWVHDNVTVFGQWAGGGSASLAPLMESCHGHIRR